jgi:hypothetical protein
MTLAKYNGLRREIYFPSVNDRERWEALAEAAGVPFSKWIYDVVELHLNSGQASPRAQAVKENAELKKELEALQNELRMKSILLERYETELYKLRHSDFAETNRLGMRAHNPALMDLLKKGRPLEGHAILKALGIDPKDAAAVKLIRNELEDLRYFGLIEETANRWRWIK